MLPCICAHLVFHFSRKRETKTCLIGAYMWTTRYVHRGTALFAKADEISANWDRRWDCHASDMSEHNLHIILIIPMPYPLKKSTSRVDLPWPLSVGSWVKTWQLFWWSRNLMLIWNPNFHVLFDKCERVDCAWCQLNPLHKFVSCFSKTQF
jgi:hypothetical protein